MYHLIIDRHLIIKGHIGLSIWTLDLRLWIWTWQKCWSDVWVLIWESSGIPVALSQTFSLIQAVGDEWEKLMDILFEWGLSSRSNESQSLNWSLDTAHHTCLTSQRGVRGLYHPSSTLRVLAANCPGWLRWAGAWGRCLSHTSHTPHTGPHSVPVVHSDKITQINSAFGVLDFIHDDMFQVQSFL